MGPPTETQGHAAAIARELAADFTGRDSVDVPGWYRTTVLPSLVRRAAIAALEA